MSVCIWKMFTIQGVGEETEYFRKRLVFNEKYTSLILLIKRLYLLLSFKIL